MTTNIIGPIGVNLGAARVTAAYYTAPTPYAVLHIGSTITLHARPGDTEPATLRDLAAKAAEIANWLEQDSAKAGEINAA
ncbi:hypothetical protein [Streptomyces violascens]|uniref:hypothetical protein n=1 Tax=Streptomyces violascens TaxID=67381 RepID=UPI0036750FE1